MKKNIKLWMSFTFIALLAVIVPALLIMPGCTISDNGTSSSTGGNKGNVTGVVTDATTGNPIENVSVTIVEATEGARATISDQTDADGAYSLQNVTVGLQTITGVISGYTNFTDTVTVVANETVVKDVPMELSTGGTVTGKVTNGIDDIKIAGATVFIGEVVAISDSNGDYTLNGAPTGVQVLKATASSYIGFQKTITVVAGETQTVDIAMAEVTPSAPAAGKANIYGRVIDSSENPVSGATVQAFSKSRDPQVRATDSPTPTPVATTTTDGNGTYTLGDVAPGTYQVTITKDGVSSTTSVSASVDTNNRATTVTLGISPTPTSTSTSTATPTASPTSTSVAGTTTWVSHNPSFALPESGDSSAADVSDDGAYVVFQSDSNVITSVNPAGIIQVYLWTSSSGTATLVSHKNSDTTIGSNLASTNPAISGDGNFVVFQTAATDIVADAGGTTATQIYIYKRADNTVARVSNNSGNTTFADGACVDPDINHDGSKVVFTSIGNNLVASPVLASNYHHVFICPITNMVPGVKKVVDSLGATEGKNTVDNADPNSGSPSISPDGRFVAYISQATNILASGNQAAGAVYLQVFRYDNNDSSNTQISQSGGTRANANCALPSICDLGAKIVFTSAATNLGYANLLGNTHVYLHTLGSSSLNILDLPGTGTERNSVNATLDKAGNYVAFLSNSTGFVSGVSNDANDANGAPFYRGYARVTSATTTYHLVTTGTSTVPFFACNNLVVSGNGNYVVFDTKSKDLTSNSYTPGKIDVFIRKWQ